MVQGLGLRQLRPGTVLALFLAGHHCVGYLPESWVRREGATTGICAINKLWVTERLFVSSCAQKDGIVCLRRWYLPFGWAGGPWSTAISDLGPCLLGMLAVPSSGLPTKHNPSTCSQSASWWHRGIDSRVLAAHQGTLPNTPQGSCFRGSLFFLKTPQQFLLPVQSIPPSAQKQRGRWRCGASSFW